VVIPLGSADGTADSIGDHPDYVAVDGAITIPTGEDTGTLDVTIVNDLRDEDDAQSFTVATDGTPTNATPGSVGGVSLAVLDDDDAPTVIIGGAGRADEGSTLEFPLTLSQGSEKAVSVQVGTADGADTGGAIGARAGQDYTALQAETVDFPADTTSRTAEVVTTDDALIESSPESFSATITNPLNATLGATTTAPGLISDDEEAPTVTLSDLSADEGDSDSDLAKVTATLNTTSTLPVTIGYAISGGTATDETDYLAATGSIVIPVGQDSGQIPVEILGDTVDEPNETVVITLSSPDGTVNAASVGPNDFAILDDDATPQYTVGDVSRDEGDTGNLAEIPVTLTGTSSENITFAITSGAGAPGGGDDTAVSAAGAVGGDDYEAPGARLTIAAGETVGYVEVAVNGDLVFESDEVATVGVLPAPRCGNARVAAAGCLVDDGENVDVTLPAGGQHSAGLTLSDDDDMPAVAFTGATGAEGASLPLTATVTGTAQDPIRLNLAYAGIGDDAAGRSDYSGASATTAFIAPGASVLALGSVLLNSDTIDEPVESFTVAATASGFTRAEGTFLITDDPADLPPTVSVADGSVVESEGSADLAVTLDFEGTTTSSQQAFTLPWSTVDGTAVSGQDFTAQNTTLTIPAGEVSGTIRVAITDDGLFEPDEDFTVQLGMPGPAGATLGKSFGAVTISSDDAVAEPTLVAPATISGPGVVRVSGVASPGATVELMLGRFTGTSLTRAAQVEADNAGRYSFTRIITAGTRFAARANGLTSGVRTVRVLQLPSLAVSSGARGAVSFTVLGNPRGAGQSVALQRLNSGGRWETVKKGYTGSAGSYRLTQRGFRSGTTWTFRSYVSGNTAIGTLPGYSAPKRVRVR
jgi:hypothetical protein